MMAGLFYALMVIMERMLGVMAFVVLANYGQQLRGIPARVMTAKPVDSLIQAFRKQHFKRPIDALSWIKRHPNIKTTGIESNLFADELHVAPSIWGRWVNDEFDLVTVRMQNATYIFHKDFTPLDQIAKALAKLPDEQFKQQGALFEKIVENVHFQRPEWSASVFHRVVGRYLRKMEEFVTHRVHGGMAIFYKGYTPKEQVVKVLDEFPKEQFRRQGLPIEKITDDLHFKQPEWDDHSFRQAIGRHIRETGEFVLRRVDKKRVIFYKGFTPEEQVAKALDNFSDEQFKSIGVPFDKIAEDVHYRQPRYNDRGFHISVGQHLDNDKFVVYRTGAELRHVIFHKGFTPKEQVAKAIDNFSDEQFKLEGVPLEKIAQHISFKQPEWSNRSFHRVISQYLDKNKFVVFREPKGRKIVYLRSSE